MNVVGRRTSAPDVTAKFLFYFHPLDGVVEVVNQRRCFLDL